MTMVLNGRPREYKARWFRVHLLFLYFEGSFSPGFSTVVLVLIPPLCSRTLNPSNCCCCRQEIAPWLFSFFYRVRRLFSVFFFSVRSKLWSTNSATSQMRPDDLSWIELGIIQQFGKLTLCVSTVPFLFFRLYTHGKWPSEQHRDKYSKTSI